MLFWFEKHNKSSWIVTIIIAIIIFYLSSLIFPPGPPGGFPWKSIAYHFYAFLFLEAFLLISIIRGKNENKKFFFVGILIILMYAVSDEIHQLFVPGRACSFSDFLTDSAGILFASLLYLLLRFEKFKENFSEDYEDSLYY